MKPELTWRYQVHTDDGRTRVVLAGEIDMSGAAELRNLLEVIVVTADTAKVEADLTEVGFIDSTAMKVLLAVQNRATIVGRRFTVANLNHRVRRVLEIVGLLDILTQTPTDQLSNQRQDCRRQPDDLLCCEHNRTDGHPDN